MHRLYALVAVLVLWFASAGISAQTAGDTTLRHFCQVSPINIKAYVLTEDARFLKLKDDTQTNLDLLTLRKAGESCEGLSDSGKITATSSACILGAITAMESSTRQLFVMHTLLCRS